MKLCNVTAPQPFVVNLGYRKLTVEPGERYYPDEVANHDQMVPYWVAGQEDPPDGEASTKPGEDLPPRGPPPVKPQAAKRN